MTVKLLTEHHLRFFNLKGGCTGSSESTLVKMPHFHVTAQILGVVPVGFVVQRMQKLLVKQWSRLLVKKKRMKLNPTLEERREVVRMMVKHQ